MFNAIRAASLRSGVRAFSTTPTRRADLSKLTLIGTLTREPEARQTKNDKEYVMYTVATTNYPPPPPDANGDRRPSATTWHRILSFQDHANRYLRTLRKGSKVFVEASFELREPEPGADPSTPQGQRQIFLRHENIRVLYSPRHEESNQEEEHF
ncbi:hypothetical protein BDN72DRAFT_835320 [Pluteus cervinus]|uniref:Uncharacterized protein n=1 Tax=Pluteus cervinus TaxID=181527 RepID=A0ACD3B5V7_9AGAR|nr:hypothetical protein BDN72DRAFT_835320 [Pluteus cervinus]